MMQFQSGGRRSIDTAKAALYRHGERDSRRTPCTGMVNVIRGEPATTLIFPSGLHPIPTEAIEVEDLVSLIHHGEEWLFGEVVHAKFKNLPRDLR
jgi:hypothetical protein